jgi:hypothetical protein
MLSLNNDFIGYNLTHRSQLFTGSDSYENFIKNKQKDPDWYYSNVKITYKRNSLGHRSKEISEIDFDNYILTTGCSHTEGVGLELDKTYSYVLGQKMKCDYYNLGIGGTGIDVMIHNLTVWLNKYKKPKALVVQWPIWSRFVRFAEDPDKYKEINKLTLLAQGAWVDNDDDSHMLILGQQNHYFKTVEKLAKIKIDTYNIPTIYVSHSIYPKSNTYEDAVLIENHDSARDGHSGIKSNEQVATQIYEKLKNLNL